MTYNARPTLFGRFRVAEKLSALRRLHLPSVSEKLTTVDHEPKVAVLDQEDLLAQGIRCSTFIPGAGNPDALGSCTCNTLVEHLSTILTASEFASFIATYGAQKRDEQWLYGNTAAAERAAIGCYHRVTDQTGSPASEWPPTDCGSSGPYLYEFAKAQGLIKTEAIAHGAQSIASLLQRNGVMIGSPWFNSWFEPDPQGFIDGDGSAAALQAAINSGIAGGHEYHGSAIEKIAFLVSGEVDPFNTVIRCRNHWTTSFAEHGSFRMRLSTIVMLGSQADVRQLRLA